MVRSVLVLYGAGSAGLVHRGGTETESRGASRDMDPAWGPWRGEERKKKNSCATDPRSGNGKGLEERDVAIYQPTPFVPRTGLRIHVVITRFPGGSNGSDTPLNSYRSLEFSSPRC